MPVSISIQTFLQHKKVETFETNRQYLTLCWNAPFFSLFKLPFRDTKKDRKPFKIKVSGVLHSVPVGAKLTSTGRHAPLPRSRCDRIWTCDLCVPNKVPAPKKHLYVHFPPWYTSIYPWTRLLLPCPHLYLALFQTFVGTLLALAKNYCIS